MRNKKKIILLNTLKLNFRKIKVNKILNKLYKKNLNK